MKDLIDKIKRLPMPARVGLIALAALIALALITGIFKNASKQRAAVQPPAEATFNTDSIIPRNAVPAQQSAQVAPSAAPAPVAAQPVITSAAAIKLSERMTENSVSRTLLVRTETRPDIEIERSTLSRTSFSVDSDSPAVAAAGLTHGTRLAAQFVAYVKIEKDERIAFSVTSESESDHAVTLRIDDRKAGETRGVWSSSRYAASLLTDESLAAGYHKIGVEVLQFGRAPATIRVAIKPQSETSFRDVVPYTPAQAAPQAAPQAVPQGEPARESTDAAR